MENGISEGPSNGGLSEGAPLGERLKMSRLAMRGGA